MAGHECLDNSPAWFRSHWRNWHRGHGCNLDDGGPQTRDAKAEIAKRRGVDLPPDVVCSHGVAMDVHCCNCHSGFIFDRNHECPPADPRRI